MGREIGNQVRRRLPVLVSLAVAVPTLVMLPGWSAPAAAATTHVATAPALSTALSTCADNDIVVVDAAISDTGGAYAVNCTLTLDLSGFNVSVRNIVIGAGRTFTVTDTTVATDPAGTLTADASSAINTAGIRNTGATFQTAGNSHLVATGGAWGAGIGGGGNFGTDAFGGAGGTTASNDDSTITATGGDHGAGIGGGGGNGTGSVGSGGDGGTTTSNNTSTITATGGNSAAGIGGGGGVGGNGQGQGIGGNGGTTTSNTTSTITATGGHFAAGIGGGSGGAGGVGGNGGTTTSNTTSTVTATGGYSAAGIGGGLAGDGGDTTSNGISTITATGGSSAAGIGGGASGDGGQVTVGAGTTVTASGGNTAIGAGYNDNGSFGHLAVAGTLSLPAGDLVIPDTDAAAGEAGDEVLIAPSGVITGSEDPSPTYATITGRPARSSDTASEGQITDHGTIRLPTVKVQIASIRDRHYDVTFDTQGGSSAPGPVTVFADTFTHGNRAFPNNPTRENFTLTGWSTTPDGTGSIVHADTILPGTSSDGTAVPITLYAIWDGDPLPAPTVVVTGVPVEGSTLRAGVTQPDGYNVPPGYTLKYRWLADGKPIKGRRSYRSTLRIRPGQVGTRLAVRVTATAPNHEPATANSTALPKANKAGDPYVATNKSAATPGDRIYLFGLAPSNAVRYRITTATPGIKRLGGHFGPRRHLRRHVTLPKSTHAKKVIFKVVMFDESGKVIFKKRLRVTIQP